jgi:UDP-3-O-[3-hydroxymyristoyl] glucosamine N-acyltransferase
MDTNHHYIVDMASRKISDNKNDIIIGEYCWVCNSTSINAGAIIPKHSIISSHSLVNKDISQWGSHILVGGIPVKLLKKGIARVFNIKNELFLFEMSQQSKLDSYCIPEQMCINKFIKFEDDDVAR